MKQVLIYLFLLPFLLSFYKVQSQSVSCVIAHYPFDGNAEDVSINGNDGVLNGNIMLTEDRFGNSNSAYYFDGVDDFIESESNDFNFGVNDYSISFWFNRESIGNHYIVSKDRIGDATSSRYTLGILSDPAVLADTDLLFFNEADANNALWNSENGYLLTTFGSILLDEWYHGVVKRKANVLTLYINGIIVSTIEEDELIDLTNDYNFRIGARYHRNGTDAPTDLFQGKIDDLIVFSCALSDQEVYDLYNDGLTSQSNISSSAIDIEIFPNPSSDRLHIINHTEINMPSIYIYNVIGHQVKEFSLRPQESKEIFVGDLASGIYFVKCKNLTKKIIIQQQRP